MNFYVNLMNPGAIFAGDIPMVQKLAECRADVKHGNIHCFSGEKMMEGKESFESL